MTDQFGYIAYGQDTLYHLGAAFSALRLLHFSPRARISVLTDKPAIFEPYPFDILELTEADKAEMSFGGRYHFGIKAAGVIKLAERCNRLLFMDSDMYPVGDISGAFERITPDRSIMRLCEGHPRGDYDALAGQHIYLGARELTGSEPMWNSGILGVHKANIPALEIAYHAMERVSSVVTAHTPEQFCVGVALSQGGKTISPHRLAIRNYSTSGKKRFARSRIQRFFNECASQYLADQIRLASTVRLWRSPFDLLAGQLQKAPS